MEPGVRGDRSDVPGAQPAAVFQMLDDPGDQAQAPFLQGRP